MYINKFFNINKLFGINKLFMKNDLQNLSKFAIPRIDFSYSKPPVLGRWKTHDEPIAHKKADMTNEDHCGVCDKMRYDYLNKDEIKK